MNNVRWLKKKNGELVLQHFTSVGSGPMGHVIWGWVDVETVTEAEASKPVVAPDVSFSNGTREGATK